MVVPWGKVRGETGVHRGKSVAYLMVSIFPLRSAKKKILGQNQDRT